MKKKESHEGVPGEEMLCENMLCENTLLQSIGLLEEELIQETEQCRLAWKEKPEAERQQLSWREEKRPDSRESRVEKKQEAKQRRLVWREKQEAGEKGTEKDGKIGIKGKRKWLAAAGFTFALLGGWLLWQAPGLQGGVWPGAGRLHQGQSVSGERPVLQWSEDFPAEQYFAYNGEADEEGSNSFYEEEKGGEQKNDEQKNSDYSFSDAPAYQWERYFSDRREEMEEKGWIPVLKEYPLFDCVARYWEAGSLYSLTFSWHKRGTFEDYKDISITAGFQEIKQIEDCIVVEIDEKGQIVSPSVTVTERDGISVVARGREKGDKTLTFQNQTGWYQIEGCWNNGYEELVDLLDWLWEHPLDFSAFPMEEGDQFEIVARKECPRAFQECLPDFSALGFTEAEAHVTLKNGEPYRFEGHYIGRVPEEVVLAGDYYEAEEWTEVHWCIATEPDVYEKQESIGELEDLTEEAALAQLEENRKLAFWWKGYLITVYINTDKQAAEDAWRVIRRQQEDSP